MAVSIFTKVKFVAWKPVKVKITANVAGIVQQSVIYFFYVLKGSTPVVKIKLNSRTDYLPIKQN